MEVPNLRAVRLRRLMTQADLAVATRMTKATISRIETGTTKARISTVRKLADALNVDPCELLSDTASSGGQFTGDQDE